MRDPLWMEGDDIDDEVEEVEDDPDRAHDSWWDE